MSHQVPCSRNRNTSRFSCAGNQRRPAGKTYAGLAPFLYGPLNLCSGTCRKNPLIRKTAGCRRINIAFCAGFNGDEKMNAAFNPSGPRQGSLTRTILLLKGPVLFLSRLSDHVSGRKEMRGNEPKEQEKPCPNQRAGSVAPDRPSRKTVPKATSKGCDGRTDRKKRAGKGTPGKRARN